jgi:hypothetical protein
VFLEVPLHSTPKELNEVEFTMKLWEENREVASFFDHFLNKILLFLKVRLKLNVTITHRKTLDSAVMTTRAEK